MASVLVIDDNETMREGMAVSIKKMGHDVAMCAGGAEGIAAFQKRRFDFVVTDLKMAPVDGLEVIRKVRELDPEAVIMVVTAFATIEAAVEAMKAGAFDFITKPFSNEVLRAKVEKGLEVAGIKRDVTKLKARNEALQADAGVGKGFEAIVGKSEQLQKLLSAVRKVAATDTTVLITGESGTGKELVARAVHDLSERKSGPFVVVHCAALAESLLESELFGHERGAFTGAIKKKLGRFELADGGTLFLDEIGEISPSIQTKLLRVLQQKEFQRVGGEETIKVDVRVVSATNRDLKAEVEKGSFREDLFYRLHIVPLHLPPLRERPGDVTELAEFFLRKHAPRVNRKVKGLTDDARRALERYAWPGNVRELENAMEQALVFCEGEELGVADLPHFVGKAPPAIGSLPVNLPVYLEQIERDFIVRAYEQAKGVKTRTAELLSVKTSALYYKLEKYGLLKPGEKPPVPENAA
ncbi:MAG: sigma-54-dependent Fis family transcriptional regulator [Deltaproteobacteria bacterium]|nr:sigma-54-dependent Fis family transcriptional regulator [Deltaproteobacteria bacterium]